MKYRTLNTSLSAGRSRRLQAEFSSVSRKIESIKNKSQALVADLQLLAEQKALDPVTTYDPEAIRYE